MKDFTVRLQPEVADFQNTLGGESSSFSFVRPCWGSSPVCFVPWIPHRRMQMSRVQLENFVGVEI
jgi:hypothetical protein